MSAQGFVFEVIDSTTGEPVGDLEEIALQESWAKGLVYCDISGWFVTEDGCLGLMDDCNNIAFPPSGRFKIKWLNCVVALA
jgi:hypothetical protein